MRLTGMGGFLIPLLVVAAAMGLAVADDGTNRMSPERDSEIVSDGLSGDRLIIPPPAVLDTLGERIARDWSSPRVLIAMVLGVVTMPVLRRGFLLILPMAPRIRDSQHSSPGSSSSGCTELLIASPGCHPSSDC